MRTGGCTVQQALTAEATVVKQAVTLARRRGHAQVTPLHVANTMLSSSAGLLRSACLRSHSHPLQCKALELCFNVALNRLPTTSSSSAMMGGGGGGPHPSLSNALTYMRCRVGNPSLEALWCLHPITIPAGGLGLSLNNHDSDLLQGQLRSKRSIDGSNWSLIKDEELACCEDCSTKFDMEIRYLANGASNHGSTTTTTSSTSASSLPSWLQLYKQENNNTYQPPPPMIR
ncbi:hypothetical protein QJS10_CPA08g01389 [Acorus calamus]|uniref:Clp R domain-containing protein n=1 Tax=Acorus calamus TaxID=4465 RepID=A0AAV9EDE9_ACOCL|nr:hypothetical protein QJS10_CPA08g01389 [Acorus calamus]